MSQSVFGSFKKVVVGFAFALLIGMLLIGLSMFGVTDAFTSQTKDAAATVGKEKITLRSFDNFFQRRLSEINKEQEERITTKQAYNRGLHRQTLDTLITEKLIQIDADDLGLAVNKRDARKLVEDLEIFNNEITGKFDKQKMFQRLYQIDRNKSPKEFEQEIHAEIRREQTVSSVLTGVVTADTFANQQYQYMTEQRTVKILRLSKDAITPPANPSDDVLKAFIKDSPAGYIAPEYRRFTILRMELDNVLPDVEVTEEEIKKHFEYKIKAKQLGTPETRSYQQLIAKDKAQADAITAAINSGAKIKDVITQFSLEEPLVYEDATVDDSTDPTTGESAYKIEKVDTATTVESSFGGWNTVILTGITEKTIPDLESQRENLTAELKNNKAKQVLYDASKAIQDGISEESMTLEDAARANGVSVASLDYISRNGLTQEGKRLDGLTRVPGVATDDKILKEIFLADTGFDGDVFTTSKDGIAAVRVDKILESAPRPFEDVKEQALAAWHIKEADKALATLSDKLLARAQAGESLDDIAKSIDKGAKVEERKIIRAAGAPDLGPQVFVRLFDGSVDQVIRGTAANGLDRIIGQVVSIDPNTDPIIPGIADTFKKRANDEILSDIQRAYHGAILAENPTQTMTSNIERTLGLDQQ